jgi:hypothetical protein
MNINLKLELLKIFNLEFHWETGRNRVQSDAAPSAVIEQESLPALPGPDKEKQ